MTKKVLIYLRDSSATMRTASAKTQLSDAKSFIRKNGWKLELICRDEDNGQVVFTAQPGVQQLLEEVDAESIDIVLCHTLERLCSRLALAVRLVNDLSTKDIEIWVADPGIQVTTKELIDYYCNDPGALGGNRRHRAQMPEDLPDVEYLVPLPYGYSYTGAYNNDGQYIFGFKTLEPESAGIVARIFQMYADGVSPSRIAEVLNAEGVPGPQGRKWRDVTIRGGRTRRIGILDDDIYIGHSWVPGRNCFASAKALRIVSDELWNRVKNRQSVMARNRKKSQPHP